MVVQHNISAMNANRLFGINNSGLAKSLEKLSSGYSINRAGDNAAGLAVSEKMRAQISGLTQASKNAEDGISMVQTFEGALQETDSILQRMRTLAVQSANGTYQNDVDREAIQLEFDQLNDELNQIADTDFNGVVVLNGGQMADGLKAVDGEFNYANSTRDAIQLGSKDIISVDSKATNKASADEAWKAWSKDAYNRADASKTNDGPNETEITFRLKDNGAWEAIDATGGMNVDEINKCVVNTTKQTTAAGTANNGGFQLMSKASNGSEIANVILDTTDLVAGDTIKIKVSNPLAPKSAPENIGVAENGISYSNGFVVGETKTKDALESGFKAEIGVKYSSTNNNKTTEVTADVASLYEKLNGATVTATYTDGVLTAAGAYTLKLSGSDTAITSSAAGADLKVGDTTFKVKNDGGVLKILDSNGTDVLAQFTPAAGDSTSTTAKTAGTMTFKIATSTTTFDQAAVPAVEVSNPDASQVSRSNSNNASTATLTYTDNITLQTGARTKDSVNFTFAYESRGLGDLKADLDCSARGLGTDKLSLATQADANKAIDKIDNAINKVSMVRGTFGAMQNRLEHKIANLNTNNENLTAAESRIRDTDMAKEMTNFTKNQILSQASQAMLAQANQLPQGVLQLLG